VRVINSRRMRLVGHVARMGSGEAYTGLWLGNLRERDHLGDPGVDGRIIVRWILRKCVVGVWTELSWFQDRGRWWALVNVVMNLRVLLNAGKFLTGQWSKESAIGQLHAPPIEFPGRCVPCGFCIVEVRAVTSKDEIRDDRAGSRTPLVQGHSSIGTALRPRTF
jgi:hypothetical protein